MSTILERALRSRRSDISIRALAAEYRSQSSAPLPLDSALRVLLAMASDPDPALYERGCERWLDRYRSEATGGGILDPPDGQEVALMREALRVLPRAGTPGMATTVAEAGVAAMAGLLEARNMPRALELLDLWVDGRMGA